MVTFMKRHFFRKVRASEYIRQPKSQWAQKLSLTSDFLVGQALGVMEWTT